MKYSVICQIGQYKTLPSGGRVAQCIWKFATINHSFEGISPMDAINILNNWPTHLPRSSVSAATASVVDEWTYVSPYPGSALLQTLETCIPRFLPRPRAVADTHLPGPGHHRVTGIDPFPGPSVKRNTKVNYSSLWHHVMTNLYMCFSAYSHTVRFSQNPKVWDCSDQGRSPQWWTTFESVLEWRSPICIVISCNNI